MGPLQLTATAVIFLKTVIGRNAETNIEAFVLQYLKYIILLNIATKLRRKRQKYSFLIAQHVTIASKECISTCAGLVQKGDK